jgi:hypothetical protein
MKANQLTDDSDFVGFHDFEIAKLERNLSWIQENRTSDPVRFQNFKTFVDQLDERRDTNFSEVFPELQEVYHNA